ncbi:MAG: leucine-rich repeat protein [Oscillospiraceae bacterium]|nr:leucine-rich repeat protein [Oscillospiraceae bacterium]
MRHKWELPPDLEAGGLTYSFVFTYHGQLRMKVTGAGRIPGAEEPQPWLRYQDRIAELWIDEGMTEIGPRAFCGHAALKKVWLPESMKEVGYMAFRDCPGLEEVEYIGTFDQLQGTGLTDSLPEQFYREVETDAL